MSAADNAFVWRLACGARCRETGESLGKDMEVSFRTVLYLQGARQEQDLRLKARGGADISLRLYHCLCR
jgi:hypothetical protein